MGHRLKLFLPLILFTVLALFLLQGTLAGPERDALRAD